MTTKADISREIKEKIGLSMSDSKNILDSFLNIILIESKTKKLKLNKFGTFQAITSPARIGRNPKSGDLYPINPVSKVSFKSSQVVKQRLN